MSGFFLIDFITRRVRAAARRKRVRLATGWPQAAAEINSWKLLDVSEESGSFTITHRIEAGFYFVLHEDYFGGYLKSVPMSRQEAEKLATGNPSVTVRYNPANPDQVVVLAEDNAANLPFAIIPG
jgi:hypothetical protein